jgi:hypothetical protein
MAENLGPEDIPFLERKVLTERVANELQGTRHGLFVGEADPDSGMWPEASET